jgi:hypothetical protein
MGAGTKVRGMLRSPEVSNPASAMASTVRRFGLQPEESDDVDRNAAAPGKTG